MILMVHNNGGSPKWWAKEGKFGRGSAMWGPIEYMHLGKTEGETSATWLDKQKTGYDVVVDGIPASTLMLLSGSYSSCLLYTSPSPRDRQKSRMPSSA